MPKLFAPLIEGGKITDEAGLKRLFREAVKKFHPDSASDAADPEKFIALYREYEEALVSLREAARPTASDDTPASEGESGAAAGNGSTSGAGSSSSASQARTSAKPRTEAPRAAPAVTFDRFSPRELLDEFMDFMARGFPSRPPVKFSRSRYDLSRVRVLAMLAAPGGPGPAGFLAFEAAFAGIDPRKTFASDSVFAAMYAILSLHHLGWRHVEGQIDRYLAGCAALGLGAEVAEFLGYLYGLAKAERRRG